MTAWILAGFLLMFAATEAACIAFLAGERGADRADLDALTKQNTALKEEIAYWRDRADYPLAAETTEFLISLHAANEGF